MIGLGLGSQPTTECGIFGSYQSLNLDGNSDYVSLPDSIKDQINKNYTSISCWINIVQNDGNNSQQIVKIFTDTDNQMQFFYHKHEQEFRATLKTDGGTNRIAIFDPGGPGYTGWQHFAATYSINSGAYSVKIYRNGSLVQNTSGGSGQAEWVGDINNIHIGANQDGTGAFVDGQIDQVGIWSVELTAAAITDIYNNGVMTDLTTKYGNYTQARNLIGYYQFEGNALDLSLIHI